MASKKVIAAIIGIVIIAALFGGYFAFTKLKPGAAKDDIVKVDYILKLENGTVFDTSIQTVAEENNIYNAARTYQPMQLTVGSGQVIKGFDNALIGMHTGQTKTITVSPADGYGEWKIENVANISKSFESDRYVTSNLTASNVPTAAFTQNFGANLSVGDIITDPQSGLKFKITDMNDENVTLILHPEIGKTIAIPSTGFNATATKVTASTVTWRQDPPETAQKQYGTVIYTVTATKITETLDVKVGDRVSIGVVTEVTDDTVLIDMNSPLAGKTLIFTITMVDIMKPASSSK